MMELAPGQMAQQIESAHSALDDWAVPRTNGPVTLTLRGRLDWLRDRSWSQSGPDASHDHRCLTFSARWTPAHPDEPLLNGRGR